MSLLRLWESNPQDLQTKRLEQLIAFAGDGKLRDGSETAREFRAFLARVRSDALRGFVDECLRVGFQDSGLALQDVVNEIGRRLGFVVENGAYQGRQGQVGFDGIWTVPSGHCLVVEVKTTDAYRIPTDRVAGYRRQLAATGRFSEAASSVLLVVGRQDTGELEAQIRGSRHAWDIRVISVEALLRLMALKQSLDDPRTMRRISEILIPKEFTRLDEIVELVFSATEEVKDSDRDAPDGTDVDLSNRGPTGPVAFHDACVARLAERDGVALVRESRSKYVQPDGEMRVVCAVSKIYRSHGQTGFWFAFHPHQAEFLDGHERAFLLLGCGDPDLVAAIPSARLQEWLPDLWVTERPDGRTYWHLRVRQDERKLWLARRKGKGQRDISEFVIRPAA